MALYPMNYGGYLEYGCREDNFCQIVISSDRKIGRSTYYVSYGPLPGIF